MTSKLCAKCGVLKPLDSYYRQAAGKYGRTSRCIECTSEEHRLYKLRIQPPSVREKRVRKQALLQRGLKECAGCGEVKSIETDFFLTHGKVASRCKLCNMAAHRQWKSKNPEHMLAYTREYASRDDVSERRRQNRIKRIADNPRHVLNITLCHGLRRRPTENPATADDLLQMWRDQGGRCSVSGILMTWGKGRVLPTSISLDRIDHDGGYSKDNIRLVCHAINAFRGRMTDEDMVTMAMAIVANAKPKLRLVS